MKRPQSNGQYTSKLDPEFLIDAAGSWNRYQALQTSCFILIVILFSYGHYLPILYLYTPEHHCFIPGGDSWNMTQQDLRNIFIPRKINSSLKFEQCIMFDVNATEILAEGIREVDLNWPVVKCPHGWDYESDNYFNSVSSEFDFVCDYSWKGPFTDTFFFIGGALGMLLNGWIGDRFGRFWAVIISNFFSCFFGIALGFAPNYIFFTIIRFGMGLFVSSGMTSFLLIAMELVSPNKRTFIGNFSLGLGVCLGGVILPGLFYLLKDWRLVNHVLYAQGLLLFLLPMTTNESIRWLLERSQYKKASKVLQRVAKFNGKKLDSEVLAELANMKDPKQIHDEESSEDKVKKHTSILALIKTPRLRRHFLIMLVLRSLITILFESFLRGMKSLRVHIYYSFMFSNFLGFLAAMVVVWTMEWFGRRWMCMLSCFLSGVAMFASAYIQESTNDEIALLALSLFARFCSYVVINVGIQFQMEICPTDLRSRGSGIIFFAGELSSFLAPYIIYSAEVYDILPHLILGCLGLLMGVLSLLLPETAAANLPANAEEAEEFGRHDNFFYVPILNNREKKRF